MLVPLLVMVIMEGPLLALEEEGDIMLTTIVLLELVPLELATRLGRIFLYVNTVGVKATQRTNATQLLDILLIFSLRGSQCMLIKLILGKRLEVLIIRTLEVQLQVHILVLSSLRINTIRYYDCCPNLVMTMQLNLQLM